MLAAEKDALSSAASVDSSYPMVNHDQGEEDDDWVLVKKQKITILIPPASPVCPQTESQETNRTQSKSRKSMIRSTPHKRRHRHSKSRSKKPAATLSYKTQIENVHEKPAVTSADNGVQTNAVSVKSRRLSHNFVSSLRNGTPINGSNQVSGKPLSQQVTLTHVSGDGNIAVPRKAMMRCLGTSRGTSKLPIGASNVVNLRMRALNLERRLNRFGGLRNWLVLQGLGRFIQIFENEKLGMYQLVNLTMGKLKDMGADAVGPRRKLIHAIDSLCQPYHIKA